MSWESEGRVSAIDVYKSHLIDALMEARKLVSKDPIGAVNELDTLTDVLPPPIREMVEERVKPVRDEAERRLNKMPTVLTSEEEYEVMEIHRQLAKVWMRAIIDVLTESGFIIWERETIRGVEKSVKEGEG